MKNIELIRVQMNHLVSQSRNDLFLLSSIHDKTLEQQVLQRLWDSLSSIHFLNELLVNQIMLNSSFPTNQQQQQFSSGQINHPQIPPITPLPIQYSLPQSNPRIFTLEELAEYDGKNGRLAYVAVNGLVYDVTNNRAWAAATHFGLTSGKDYTQEFSTCHAGMQSILATLPVVGRLA